MSQSAFYKDCRLGKYDTVIHAKSNGEIRIGKIEKVSSVTKVRQNDGTELDQKGDPQYYYVYPKFHPDEAVIKARPLDLKLCDRYLKIGFIIKDSETGRVGFVQGLKQQITAKLLDYNLILRDIEFRELMDPWKLDIQFKRPVYLDGWIGRIACPVERMVFVRYTERNSFRAFAFSIPWNQLAHILVESGLIRATTFFFESSGFAFWPGRKFQVPRGIIASPKYNIDWSYGTSPDFSTSDHRDIEVTLRIDKTQVNPVLVQWLKRVPGFATSKPKSLFRDVEISQLTIIRPTQISHLGDVRMYRLKRQDVSQLVTEELWKLILRRRYWLARPKGPIVPEVMATSSTNKLGGIATSPSFQVNELVPVEVIYTRSTAEVAWIDGTISRVDTTKICRVYSQALEVGSTVESTVPIPSISLSPTYGVVQLVKVLEASYGKSEKIALIKWFHTPTSQQGSRNLINYHESSDVVLGETEMSLKQVQLHPEYNFKSHSCHNVVVCRAREDIDFTVGYVVNAYPDGKIRVRCLDGIVRRFFPNQLKRLNIQNRLCNGPSSFQGHSATELQFHQQHSVHPAGGDADSDNEDASTNCERKKPRKGSAKIINKSKSCYKIQQGTKNSLASRPKLLTIQ